MAQNDFYIYLALLIIDYYIDRPLLKYKLFFASVDLLLALLSCIQVSINSKSVENACLRKMAAQLYRIKGISDPCKEPYQSTYFNGKQLASEISSNRVNLIWLQSLVHYALGEKTIIIDLSKQLELPHYYNFYSQVLRAIARTCGFPIATFTRKHDRINYQIFLVQNVTSQLSK